VTNEKLGWSGSWQVFEDCFGPWRSLSVYFLMLPSSFLRSVSVPVCKDKLIGDWDENRWGAPKCSVRLFFKFFCLSANIGTPPTPSPASKCVPLWHQRGGHTHLRVKWLGSQFRRLERKPSTLSTLWTGGSVRQYIGAPMSPSANRQWWPGTVRQ
jgi:hypothetical protein